MIDTCMSCGLSFIASIVMFAGSFDASAFVAITACFER